MDTATAPLPGSDTEEDFTFTRSLNAPRDLVFRMWTERDHLQQWFGPKGCPIVAWTNDLRPGGMMHYAMQMPGGGAMWGRWVYREIVTPERFVFVASFSDEEGGIVRAPFSAGWPLEMLSVVTFAEQGDRTEITLRASAHNASELERETFNSAHNSLRQGWDGTFAQLAKYVQAVAQVS
jgi:uncharacterized protein YndB with AHSA1/START domain